MPPTGSGKKPKAKLSFGWVWGSLLISVLNLGVMGCGSESPPDPQIDPQVDPQVTPGRNPDGNLEANPPATVDPLSYENITLTQAAPDGRLQWKITATLAQYAPERTTAALTSVSGEFYDSAGDPIRIMASAGKVQVEERQVSLIGSIQGEYPRQGVLLKAQELHWIPDRHQLIASDQVYIRFQDPDKAQRQAEVSGSQLVWDTQDHLLTLSQADQPLRLVSTDPSLTLTAERIQWNLPSETIQAQGAVTLVVQPSLETTPPEPLTLRGATLTLTRKQATLTGDVYAHSPQGGELWSQVLGWPLGGTVIYASGGVRYQQPGQPLTVRGREAVLNWQTQTARISGSTITTQSF